MRQILPAVGALLALVAVGAALPRAHASFDPSRLPAHLHQAPVAKRAPWPSWAHGGLPVVATSPSAPQQPAAAIPAGLNRQVSGEHAGLTDVGVSLDAPGWHSRPFTLTAVALRDRTLPVDPPPPRDS